jgi:hypothetical protein
MPTIILIPIWILSLFGNPMAQQDSAVLTSISKPAINPIMSIGKNVRYTATIKKILNAGIPLTLLLETDGYQWIANIYSTDSIPENLIMQGKKVVVEGIITGASKPSLINATRQSLLEVMVSKVAALKKKSK